MKNPTSYISRVAQLEILLAAILILMPFFLRLSDGGARSFRESISNYVYMDAAQIFGMFLTAAACMFIYNGVINYRKAKVVTAMKKMQQKGAEQMAAVKQLEKEKPPGRNFNVVFGLSLLGVLLFPHEQFPIPHYVSAAIFFVGSIIVMAFISNDKFRKTGVCLAVISSISLGLSFAKINGFTLFWAEWIALTQ